MVPQNQNPAATAQLDTSFRSEASGGSVLHYGRFPPVERNGARPRSVYDSSHLSSSIAGGGSRLSVVSVSNTFSLFTRDQPT